MSMRQWIRFFGVVTAASLVIVALVMYPGLMPLGPIGYGASRLQRIRTRRKWVERVEEFVRQRGAEALAGISRPS